MPLVFFSWVDANGKASDLLLDASPGRTHTASAQVTEHPVEKGTPATDNIRPLPRKLSIEGMITNTPLGAPPTAQQIVQSGIVLSPLPQNDAGGGAGFTAGKYAVEIWPQTTNNSYLRGPRPPYSLVAWQQSGKFDRVKTSFVALVLAVQHGCIFTISTSLNEYSNMAATSMVVTESSHGAQALQFTMEFQELRIVETKTVLVPARQAEKDTGSHAPSKPSAEQETKVLRSMSRATANDLNVTQAGQ